MLKTEFSTSAERDRYISRWYSSQKTYQKDDPASEYWQECLERLKNWHRNRHSFDPVYMSDDFREFRIKQQKNGHWKITYYSGKTPKEVAGTFTNFKQAEQRLVNWLKRYNKGYARYPGCPKPRPTNSTELFLKDWSPKPAL